MNQETVIRTSEKQAMNFLRVQTKKIGQKTVLASMCNKNVQWTLTNYEIKVKNNFVFCLTYKNGLSFVCVNVCVY